MYTQWIEDCVVQRVSLHDGLMMDLDDYNELVISRRLRLTLLAAADLPPRVRSSIPAGPQSHERLMFDLAGAVCTQAWYGDDGGLHLGFSRGHRIDVDADAHSRGLGTRRQTPRLHGLPAESQGPGGPPRPLKPMTPTSVSPHVIRGRKGARIAQPRHGCAPTSYC